MKVKMRLFLFVAIATLLVACEPTEKELIIGKWKYSRLEKRGKAFLSADQAEAKRIIDRHVLDNMEYIKDVAKFRENAMEEMAQRLNVYLDFTTDSTVAIIDQSSGQPFSETWKYSMNEDAHNLTLESSGRRIQYIYKLENGVLELTEGTASGGLKIQLKKDAKK